MYKKLFKNLILRAFKEDNLPQFIMNYSDYFNGYENTIKVIEDVVNNYISDDECYNKNFKLKCAFANVKNNKAILSEADPYLDLIDICDALDKEDPLIIMREINQIYFPHIGSKVWDNAYNKILTYLNKEKGIKQVNINSTKENKFTNNPSKFNGRVTSINSDRKPSPKLININDFNNEKDYTNNIKSLLKHLKDTLNNAKGTYISSAGTYIFIDKESDENEIIIECVDSYDVDNTIKYLKMIYNDSISIVKGVEDQILVRIIDNKNNKINLKEIYNNSNNTKNKYLFDILFEVANDIRSHIIHKYGEDFLHGKCIEASDMIVDILTQKGVNAKTIEGWVTYDNPEGCTDRDYDEHTWVEVKSLEDKFIVDVTATQFNHFMDEDYPNIIIAGELPHGFSYEEPENSLLDESFSDKHDFARHYQKHVSQDVPDRDNVKNQMDYISPRIYEERAIELMNSNAGPSNSTEDDVIGFKVDQGRALKYHKKYNTIVIYDIDTKEIITYYKTNFKKYLAKLEKDYKGELPENENKTISTDNDDNYKLEEAINKNTLTKQQQKIIEKVFSDPILSKLANENKWSELLQYISYEEAKDLEIINKKVNLAIPENFSKDHPTYKEYLKALEIAKKSPNYEENMILIKAFQSPNYTSTELTNILNKYNIRIVYYYYGAIVFNCPSEEVSKTNLCRTLEIRFDRGTDLLAKSQNLKVDWIDKIKKKIPRNMSNQYYGNEYERRIGEDPSYNSIDVRYLDQDRLRDFYPGRDPKTLTRQELERFVDAAVTKRQAAQASEKKHLEQQIKKEDESAVKYRAEKDYNNYGHALANKAEAEDKLSSLKIPEKGYYKEELEEAKKSKKKKKKSQTQNTPVFKDINDLLRWTKKRQKGLPCFGGWLNPNAGNVEYNNDMFNHLTGADGGDFGSISGSGNELGAPAIGSDMGSFGGDAGGGISSGGGMGESFNTSKNEVEVFPKVQKFISNHKELINDEDWDTLFLDYAEKELNMDEQSNLIEILQSIGCDFEVME